MPLVSEKATVMEDNGKDSHQACNELRKVEVGEIGLYAGIGSYEEPKAK